MFQLSTNTLSHLRTWMLSFYAFLVHTTWNFCIWRSHLQYHPIHMHAVRKHSVPTHTCTHTQAFLLHNACVCVCTANQFAYLKTCMHTSVSYHHINVIRSFIRSLSLAAYVVVAVCMYVYQSISLTTWTKRSDFNVNAFNATMSKWTRLAICHSLF